MGFLILINNLLQIYNLSSEINNGSSGKVGINVWFIKKHEVSSSVFIAETAIKMYRELLRMAFAPAKQININKINH